ncbi:uncharacterized protein N7477_006213 [Penicillium maclennaniae]|uniref:uncharacterized protein n=1 Tax=Penicillium maclennaniae TaxID=1343394 RepID=UPI00254097BF|nr:uncharacterized protein N7477_006213 [Penicillium maclennaniae]KAJ5670850.1 hypothetical protein N7477_006213 [Penicillium maclennaniae]
MEMPHKKVLKLYQGLPKSYTSIVMQMRTERIVLRHLLYKCVTQRRREGDEEEDEFNREILLQYPLNTGFRATLLSELRHKTELGNLADYNTIVSKSQVIRYVAKFMHQTGILGQFRPMDSEEVELNIEMLEKETSNGC